MCRELIHIYGPISICGYGVMIFIGIVLFAYLVNRDPVRSKLLSSDTFADIIVMGTLIGLLGGRLLFILTNVAQFQSWYDYGALWDGGFSLLGAIIGNLLFLPCYLRHRQVPVIPFFDLVAVYAPLLIAVSRIGCFWSGCCYGAATSLPWAVVYYEQGADAPLGIPIHPTQLYSAIMLFCIFLFMYFVAAKRFAKPGQLMLIYLVLASIERFTVDFWRADREFFLGERWQLLSIHQYIALLLGISALIALLIRSRKWRQRDNEPI